MNSNTIQIEIDLDKDGAVKGLRQVGTESDKAFDKLDSASRKAGTGVRGAFNKMVGGAKKLAGHLGKLIAKMGKLAVVTATGVAVMAGGVAKASIQEFAGFESAMANVSTLVDTAKVDVKGLSKEVMALPAELGSATENAKALYQALSAGMDPAKSVEFVGLAAKTAKAGLTDTFTAVDAGTSVLNAFGLESDRAGEIFDQMFETVKQGKTTFGELAGSIGKLSPIAAAASMSTDEMFASIATLTKGGFATSEATSRMATALGAVIKPSSEASKLSAKLGLDFSAAALKAKGLAGFLDSVKDATHGDVEAMGKLFGGMESLSVMLALTGKQSEEFNTILGKIKDSSGAVDEAFDKQKNTLGALWETFKNTIGKQAIILGEQLAPEIKATIKETAAWFDANQDLVKSGIVEFAGDMIGAFKGAKEGVIALLPVLKSAWSIAKLVASAFNLAGKAIGWAAAKMAGFYDKVANSTVGKMVGKAVDFAMDKVAAVTTPAPTPVKGSYATGTDYVPQTGLYRLHRGESVNTAVETRAGRNGAGRSLTIQGGININLPEGTASQSETDWRRIVRSYIMPELEAAYAR